jgi:outer membrane protein TolC
VTDYALPRTYLDGAISVVQPVVDLRAWSALGTAHAAEDVAKLDVEAQKRKIVLGLASSVVAVITAERIAELSRSGLRSALERFTIAEQRRTLGGGTRLDALRARQDVDAARATVLAGDEALKQAREALGLALGLTGQVSVTPDIHLDALEANTRSSCQEIAVDGRPDVAAARGRRDVAERRIRESKRQFAPRLLGQSLLAFSSLSVEPNPVWNVQAVLSIPIWDGGARYGALRIANADVEHAEQQLIAARRNAELEIVQAHRAVAVAESRREVYVDARTAAIESDELTQSAFHTGQGTSFELVLASAQRRQAEINVAVSDFDVVRARIAELLAHARCTF